MKKVKNARWRLYWYLPKMLYLNPNVPMCFFWPFLSWMLKRLALWDFCGKIGSLQCGKKIQCGLKPLADRCFVWTNRLGARASESFHFQKKILIDSNNRQAFTPRPRTLATSSSIGSLPTILSNRKFTLGACTKYVRKISGLFDPLSHLVRRAYVLHKWRHIYGVVYAKAKCPLPL